MLWPDLPSIVTTPTLAPLSLMSWGRASASLGVSLRTGQNGGWVKRTDEVSSGETGVRMSLSSLNHRWQFVQTFYLNQNTSLTFLEFTTDMNKSCLSVQVTKPDPHSESSFKLLTRHWVKWANLAGLAKLSAMCTRTLPPRCDIILASFKINWGNKKSFLFHIIFSESSEK